MTTYFLRRLLQAIPTLIGITLISFTLMRAAPGDPVALLTFNPDITNENRDQLRAQLCLDRSIAEQYIVWLLGDFRGKCRAEGIIRGDFGDSFFAKRPVIDMIFERIPATLELTATALAYGLILGVTIGIYSAVKHGNWFDNIMRFVAVIGNAVPVFWLGLILILVFAVQLGWLPVGGRYTLNQPKTLVDHLQHLLMPSFVLAVTWIAILSRFMRTETLEVMRQDYIRTARAKGIANSKVYFSHAARNALIPLATIIGPAIGGLLAGAVVTERIFSWPGMGRLALDAVFQRDYPLVMASVIISSVLVVAGNLLSDMLYGIIDPRIRLN